jgi:hypothetical protein
MPLLFLILQTSPSLALHRLFSIRSFPRLQADISFLSKPSCLCLRCQHFFYAFLPLFTRFIAFSSSLRLPWLRLRPSILFYAFPTSLYALVSFFFFSRLSALRLGLFASSLRLYRRFYAPTTASLRAQPPFMPMPLLYAQGPDSAR